MAKQMPYTDAGTGVVCPASVALPMFVALDMGGGRGRVVFQRYASLAALAAGKGPVGPPREYVLDGVALAAFLGAIPAAVQAVIDQAYTLIDPADPFFVGSTDVTVDVVSLLGRPPA